MRVDRRNAVSSWSGYNHQGKVGIYLALTELKELIGKGNPYKDYKLILEKNGGEDVEICQSTRVISRHQVKAKKKGRYPNDYRNVRSINSKKCPSGYQTSGTTKDSRFLHVICEVQGWDMNEEVFQQTYKGASYVPNKSRVQLYTYPDNKKYCDLVRGGQSPIDNFCEEKIKEILIYSNSSLKDDSEHIEETLCEIKDLVSRRISQAHNNGNGVYPVIYFQEILKIIISQEKRHKQSIRRAKLSFEMYWNNIVEDDVDTTVINQILNLPDDKFEQLLIDLHPDNNIAELQQLNNIDNLIDKDSIGYILYEFLKNCKQERLLLDSLRYDQNNESLRLSMIHAPKAAARNVSDEIIKNINFLEASFDTDYLINMNINGQKFFEEKPIHEGGKEKLFAGALGEEKNRIFSNNLEYIDCVNTVEKLKED
ncbi:ABC-three component system protein [Streptococcus sp. HMSC062H02]|jgi:hypothetical protein|uniref:ABC-three component system protein n=1 Tax=Streptococcus sp. HMSC062H02 TaxID=1739389 RepID=UPI0008A599EF|nr:ABC-three component system protein [Streptococcus sp. HMSC062H02]OFR45234.1 hypothetical protein HMPREF2885_01520 [Streptococcus sp. HMSC062H02]